MAIEKKLCMLKSEFNESPLKKKLEKGEIELLDLKGYFKEKKFKDKEDKTPYCIIESSFFLKNKNDNGLLLINRNPIGFDGNKRISDGLSFLFSLTPNFNNSFMEECALKIKKEFSFVKSNNEIYKNITFSFTKKGLGYNTPQGRATYIFFVYEVTFNEEIKNIIQLRSKDKKLDMDYIFQVNGNFIKESHRFFLNPTLHFDIVTMKSLSDESLEVRYKEAHFFSLKNKVSKEYKINLEKISIMTDLLAWLNQKGNESAHFFIKELFDDDKPSSQAIMSIIDCVSKIGLSSYKVVKNLV